MVGSVIDFADPPGSFFDGVEIACNLLAGGLGDSNKAGGLLGMEVSETIGGHVPSNQEFSVAELLHADALVLGVSGHPNDEVVGRVVEGKEQQHIDPRVLPMSRRGPLDAAMYGNDARLAIDA